MVGGWQFIHKVIKSAVLMGCTPILLLLLLPVYYAYIYLPTVREIIIVRFIFHLDEVADPGFS